MRNSPLLAGLIFAAVLGFSLGSCSSSTSTPSDGSTTSGQGGAKGGFMACPGGTTSGCSQAEIMPYSNCVIAACSSAFTMCYGSGYASGNFSGPCGTYGQCSSACGCDQTCAMNCGTPPTACQTCLFNNLVPCIQSSSCQLPACAGGAGGTAGGTGGRAGGAGGFTGSLGGSTGTTGTCADLLACCNAASATLKPTCMTEYNTVVSMGDATCGALLSGIKSTVCP